jgi:transposase/transposase InsO family protein
MSGSQRKKLRKKTYVSAPEPPADQAARYQTILEVLSGKLTVSAAAKQLGMSRNHFQTLMHRGLEGLIEKTSPQPSGRPAKNPREAALEVENERLRRQNAQLQERVDTIDRLLGVASDMLKGRVEATGRGRKSKASATASKRDDGDEPDFKPGRQLQGAMQMRQLGVPPALAAAVVGVGASTLRRWAEREQRGQPLRRRAGPATAPVQPEVLATALDVVKQLGGQIGVRALAKQVPELSRSQASEIKHSALTELERARKQQAMRIQVTVPGVLRGFDAMQVLTIQGLRWLLIAADASIPFRTTGIAVDHYDGPSVALALESDILRHGPPLAYRLDRWKAHETADVLDLLAKYGVLILHGPPYYPRFYGQLERQNREHRRILDAAGMQKPDALPRLCNDMLRSVNELWPRRALDWRTPRAMWDNRQQVEEDRDALREEVNDRANRIARKSGRRDVPHDFFERIAIECALEKRGYLRRQERGRC